jgi:hypothetical protein
MLFDPFEKQFNHPSTFIQLCDGECGEGEIVGEKGQIQVMVLTEVADTAKLVGILLCCIDASQNDGLVTFQASGFTNGM